MSDSQVESSKALGLARKYDDQGDLANAIKWCKKSISIHSTPEASALLSRLETKGVNGASSSSTSASTPGSTSAANGGAGGAAANGGSAARARTTGSGGKEKAKEEARAYTPEQAAVVAKIKAAGGDFYKVLSVEKTVEENGIKKAYRKLALQLHPDKNGAPGADEAFKLVSKAFTILSDADKRAQYDRYGGDPDQRGGGGGGGAGPSMSPFGRPGGAGMYGRGEEIDPQDLFNMFFGGGMGGMNGFGGGTTFSFGGPGMQRTYHRAGMQQPRRGARAGQAPAENPNLLLQLLPILLLAFFSLLSYLPSMMGPKEPGYTWAPSGRFREQHMTGGRGVAYYVDKREWENNEYIKTSGVGPRSNGLRSFEAKVENSWKNVLYQQCSSFRDYQEQRIDRTRGFFGIGADRETELKIRKEKSPACEELLDFGLSIPIRA
ncbi:DnaJ-domain-containing protein [Microstroma glucosiphilum]|uniref:DnaJ-domain-containing protein n=1 Tax=Pseudomicrostroma glucosiphilum TaxID=1684307 RepID=A0A316U1Z7_9BASI|nr:DnaJ-domain-containing protein [Pseudomicrostroma glucosiphilum]PWN19386.1 DnaJ-domain-containing protein [Pseudomicrostroma glucosiphilum]